MQMDYLVDAMESGRASPEEALTHDLSTAQILSTVAPVQGSAPDVDQSGIDSASTVVCASHKQLPCSVEHEGPQQQQEDATQLEDPPEMGHSPQIPEEYGDSNTNRKAERKENICPASIDAELSFCSEQNNKPILGKDKNTMLLDYLDEMKNRRQELQALRTRPKWALMPVSSIQHTKHAADEESQTVGAMLHEFFNCSAPAIKSDEMHQDTKHQHITKHADTMADLQQPNILPPPNIELCKAEGSLPLVPKLPNFKHTSPSIMLGDLVQGLQTLGCQETTQDHDAKEMLQTTNFHSLEYRLREYIWTLALPQTRIIELAKSETYSVHSSAAVPALLHTCRESRAIALNHYNLSFSSPSTSPKVYFDFKYDWLYTRCSGCIGIDCTHKLTLTDDHKKLKGLVFEGPMTYNPFPKILRFYPAIERIILIGGKSTAKRGEIHKSKVSFMTEVFDWDQTGDVMGLARKAWEEWDPTGEKPLPLIRVWRASLPDVVDNIKRSSDPEKGLWTCCS